MNCLGAVFLLSAHLTTTATAGESSPQFYPASQIPSGGRNHHDEPGSLRRRQNFLCSSSPLMNSGGAQQTTFHSDESEDISEQMPEYYNANHQQPAAVVTTTSSTTTLGPRGGGKKLSNLKERTISAVLLLAGLIIWIDTFREKGLIMLVLLVQIGLFREGTNVVLSEKDIMELKLAKSAPSIKWWWFAAYNMALSGPRILSKKHDGSTLLSPASIYMCSFAMVALGIVSFVLTLNNQIAFSYEFQVALQEMASYHLAIALLIVPSSFWIATIQDFGMKWVLYSLYLVMINDTMAYVFGASFGKHPLLPTISPKKTWEGFLGALVSTMAFSTILWKAMSFRGDMMHALIIAAYCSLIAPFGGFLASIVKRAYGKKDFSNLIAGHGGFIDRLDCQIITAPFIYLYLRRFVIPWKA